MSQDFPQSTSRSRLVCLFLVLSTVSVYWPVVFQGFVYFDDPTYVSNNPIVLDGLTGAGARWAFTTFHFGNWHPLTWLSYMVDVEIFGSWPGGFHLTNVLLHLGTSLLVFVALRRMTDAVWCSAGVAALFALHPLHVESVAWISERKDVLSGLFAMLTIISYASWVRRPDPLGRVRTTVLFALGLMVKPMLVTLPFVLVLLDHWPLGRLERVGIRGLLLEKVPLFTVALLSCVVTILSQQEVGAVTSLELVPVGIRFSNALVSYVAYVGMTFWPQDLAVFYPYPKSIPVWKIVGALGGLLVVTAVVLHQWRRRPFLAVGWLWFLGMLVPVVGLVQVGPQAMADRYMYLPILGLLVAAVWGAAGIVARWPSARRGAVAVGVASVVLCAAASSAQLAHWQSSARLFERVLDVTGESVLALNNLGAALVEERRYDDAIAPLRRAIELDPTHTNAWGNLARAQFSMGRLDEAVKSFRVVVTADPNHGWAQHGLAASLVAQGRSALARSHAERAVELLPRYAQPKQLLALIERDLRRRPTAPDEPSVEP